MSWNFDDDVGRVPRSVPRAVAPVAEAGRDLATADMATEWPRVKEDMITELDAVVAHLYGLSNRQFRVIFETFHIGWEYEDRLLATLKHSEAWKGRL